ncbi:MAG: hypothetical protein GVY36_17615 [Verrucomicrobia bacterium]|jgi:hypothetical protein|nr:hypothetical protein [Verrucomicrobiota bacterium]
MGLFDTIRFSPALQVPGWKEPVREMQTKLFGSAMQEYRVGSLLPESPALIGVVEDSLWLAPKKAGAPGQTRAVYFVIWHRILAGVYLDAEAAEERLRRVDRLDLITWLDEAQRAAEHWKRRHNRLFTDVSAWHKHLKRAEEGTEEENPWDRISWRLPEEILAAADPLAAILETHRKDDTEAEMDTGAWFP